MSGHGRPRPRTAGGVPVRPVVAGARAPCLRHPAGMSREDPHTPPFTGHRPPAQGRDPLDAYRRQPRPAPRDHPSHPADPSPPTRPWVLTNFVAGLDGAVTIDGRVDGLSSPDDQTVFHLLRSLADVVLVGAGTFRAEPYAPFRLSPAEREERTAHGRPPVPHLAVVSRSLQLDWERSAFTDSAVRPLVITSGASDPRARARAERVADVEVTGREHVDVGEALGRLHARGHRVVLCEGGPSLLSELVADDLLDELCLTLAPLVGGDPSRVLADEPRVPLTRFALTQVMTAGDELYLRYLRDPDTARDGADDG